VRWLSLIVSGLATLLISGTHVCATPVQWSGNNHWYEPVLEEPGVRIGWQAAQADAISRRGYLATVTSAEENQFVFALLGAEFWEPADVPGNPNYRVYGPWLGATDALQEGNWQWVTGEPWNYIDWARGEPNNLNGDEHYLQYLYKPDPAPTWNDAHNFSARSYVVEYNSIPEPSALALLVSATIGLMAYVWRRRMGKGVGP